MRSSQSPAIHALIVALLAAAAAGCSTDKKSDAPKANGKAKKSEDAGVKGDAGDDDDDDDDGALDPDGPGSVKQEGEEDDDVTLTSSSSDTTTATATQTDSSTATDTGTSPPPRRTAWDFDGDGRADLMKFWKEGTEWDADVHVTKDTAFEMHRFATKQGGMIDSMQWFPGDFDGDGRWDVAKFWPDPDAWTADVHLSNGTSFDIRRFATKQGGFLSTMRWLTGDFDGNGMTDFLVYWPCGAQGNTMCSDVHLSNGKEFGIARWATEQGGIFDGMTWVAADFDGDGKTDLAKFWNDGGYWTCDVHIATSSGFRMERWATQQGGYIAPAQWTVGDFDGDGKADFAKYFNEEGAWDADVHLSTGTGFEIHRFATKQGATDLPGMRWVTGDFDGDGKTDYASYWPDGGYWTADVHRSTGTAFTIERWATQQGGNPDYLHWVNADFNGDGKTDFASYWACGAGPAFTMCSDVHLSTGTAFGIQRFATEQGGIFDGMTWWPYRSQ